MNELKINGFPTCPKWLHDKYRLAVSYICQSCNKHEEIVGKLIPHRIVRGNQGGLYTLYPLNHKINNIKVICKDCHSKIHQLEIGVSK